MHRDLLKELKAWRGSPQRKPLLLHGARQVGKTYLLKKFGEEYRDVAYFNFEFDPQLDSLFQGKLDPQLLIEKLSIYRERKIVPRETLVIFDEIQESDKALNSLKYFSEFSPDFHLAAAGSLLGIKLSKTTGFPVGKVNFLTLAPMSFLEFLSAVGKENLRGYIETLRSVEPLPEAFHQELIDWLKKYLLIGGMPEAVASYAEHQDFEKVREIQQDILKAYQLDFSKHVSASDILKIAAIWNSVPSQLAKENKKFIFTALRKSARAREYESALQWLDDAGLIHKSYYLPTPKLPFDAYAKKDFFKIYMLDVGLLGSMSRLPPKVILEGDRLFQEFAGALAENYVAQSLVASNTQAGLYYWTSEGIAELDFVTLIGGSVVPLEVKAGVGRGKKSLLVFQKKYKPQKICRASLRNLKRDGNFINIPLYLVGQMGHLL